MTHSGEQVLHLVSPRPVDWDVIFTPIAQCLRVPLIPYVDWLALLNTSANEDNGNIGGVPSHNTAISLLEFFQQGSFGDNVQLDTVKAVNSSGTLASMAPLRKDDAMKWMQYWVHVGYLKI